MSKEHKMWDDQTKKEWLHFLTHPWGRPGVNFSMKKKVREMISKHT